MTTNEMEVWKFIPDYPNYEVSNYGRVRSWTGNKKGKLLATRKDKCGYVTLGLSNKDGRKTFVGERPKGLQIRHLDGNPGNNYLSNLAYGTPKENGQDAVKHGTSLRGERNRKSKLISADIYLIRLLEGFGWTNPLIAKIMCVSHQQVWNILQGKMWSHI